MLQDNYLNAVYELKDTIRTGWQNQDVTKPENVSSHSYSAAMLSKLYSKKMGFDSHKITDMLLVHDLAESKIGDKIVTRNGVTNEKLYSQKKVAEIEQFGKIFNGLEEELNEMYTLAIEYIEQKTPEAIFAHQIDKLDMANQALYYARNNRTDLSKLEEFFISAQNKITLTLLKKDFEIIYQEFQKLQNII